MDAPRKSVQLVGLTECRVLIGGRTLVVQGERLFPASGQSFWALPPSRWRWDDGSPVEPGERAESEQIARSLALAAGIELDVDPEPSAEPVPRVGALSFSDAPHLRFQSRRGEVVFPGGIRLGVRGARNAIILGSGDWRWGDGRVMTTEERAQVEAELRSTGYLDSFDVLDS
jgi:hypothetical protein